MWTFIIFIYLFVFQSWVLDEYIFGHGKKQFSRKIKKGAETSFSQKTQKNGCMYLPFTEVFCQLESLKTSFSEANLQGHVINDF